MLNHAQLVTLSYFQPSIDGHLIAPIVRPSTSAFWDTHPKITIGSAAKSAAAENEDKFVLIDVTELTMNIGNVWALELVNMSANKNSFQAKIIARTAAVVIPGIESGPTILKNSWRVDEPSTVAASIISRGMSI
jgi:hypothetical protein